MDTRTPTKIFGRALMRSALESRRGFANREKSRCCQRLVLDWSRRATIAALFSVDNPASPPDGPCMTGDRTMTDPESGKAQPADESRAKPPMDELSRRLGERLARQRAADPGAATAARRAALQAYDQARERRLIAGLSVVLAVTVGAALAYFVSVSTIDERVLWAWRDSARIGVSRTMECGTRSQRGRAPARPVRGRLVHRPRGTDDNDGSSGRSLGAAGPGTHSAARFRYGHRNGVRGTPIDGSNGTGDRSLRKSFRPVGLLADHQTLAAAYANRGEIAKAVAARSATNRSQVDDRAASGQARLGQVQGLGCWSFP
jgi:hypothetical protein